MYNDEYQQITYNINEKRNKRINPDILGEKHKICKRI